MPCYFTKELWNLFQDKAAFKQLCREHNVPVTREYKVGRQPSKEELNSIEYPVIVKPVDLAASKGISICKNEEELIKGLETANSLSASHSVLVEQYVRGDEISATYTFINGECKLSMLSQMYYNTEQKGFVPLPDAYIYPSKYLPEYVEQVDSNMIKMLKSSGFQNGTVFITGMATDKGFFFFEAGLRMAATVPYIFVSKINGINIMKLMTEYAINGCIEDTKEQLALEDPTLKGKKCCLFSLLNGGGTIKNVSGLQEIENMPGIIRVTVQRHIGDYIKKDGTLGQVHLRFYIVKDTIEEIKEVIKKIIETVRVTDENGNNMLLKSVATDLM